MTGRRQIFYATCLWAAVCLLLTVLIIFKVGTQ
jgi:hypothetical protein